MTLGIAVLTNSFAVMASDRRLTIGHQVVTDSQDKMCVIMTDDARAVLSFSGLAKVHRFNFHDWLVDKIEECAKPDFQLPSLLNRLKEKLDDELFNTTFAKVTDPIQRSISIHIAGFRYMPNVLRVAGINATPFYAFLSNYEKLDGTGDLSKPSTKFDFGWSLPNKSAAQCKLCGAIGNIGAISTEELKEIVEKAYFLTPRSVALKLNAVIANSSNSVLAANNIGGKVSTVVIPADPGQSVVGDFHSDEPSPQNYLPATVICKSSGGMVIKEMSIWHGGKNPPAMVVPQVARKSRCPCGSGLRYRDCHGRRFVR